MDLKAMLAMTNRIKWLEVEGKINGRTVKAQFRDPSTASPIRFDDPAMLVWRRVV